MSDEEEEGGREEFEDVMGIRVGIGAELGRGGDGGRAGDICADVQMRANSSEVMK